MYLYAIESGQGSAVKERHTPDTKQRKIRLFRVVVIQVVGLLIGEKGAKEGRFDLTDPKTPQAVSAWVPMEEKPETPRVRCCINRCSILQYTTLHYSTVPIVFSV